MDSGQCTTLPIGLSKAAGFLISSSSSPSSNSSSLVQEHRSSHGYTYVYMCGREWQGLGRTGPGCMAAFRDNSGTMSARPISGLGGLAAPVSTFHRGHSSPWQASHLKESSCPCAAIGTWGVGQPFPSLSHKPGRGGGRDGNSRYKRQGS